MILTTFEGAWSELESACFTSSFSYDDPHTPFSQVVDDHFRTTSQAELHGVYLIRKKHPSREVLRVGKAGSVTRGGLYKAQDIPGRLKNVKGDVPANQYFSQLLLEEGPLLIQYVCLPPKPMSASLVEATLLQAYLNERGSLPPRNSEL